MKLHLPKPLFHALIACLVSSVVLAGTSFAESADSVTYTTHQDGPLNLSEYSAVNFENIEHEHNGAAIYHSSGEPTILSLNDSVLFSGNTATSTDYDENYGFVVAFGGAIYNHGGSAPYNKVSFTLNDNGDVTFRGNTATATPPAAWYGYGIGGAIGNSGSNATFTLSGNESVTFSENYAFLEGGAIYNDGTFTLSDNGAVSFSGNTSESGSAIYNGEKATFTLSGNGDVTFSGNTAGFGGAICIGYDATFTLSGNGDVTFSGNTAGSGGAISICTGYDATFTLSGNGDVLFERNVENEGGTYRLRSIYSSMATLNLSASEGKSILFRDSVYASGTVNLNSDGTGDIIFTGATTAADLFEVKGTAGTKAEIQCSQTSQFHSDVALGGGSLQVQEGAKLTFTGLSVGTASQSASLQMQNGWVDVSKPLLLASGSSLSLSGCNYLLSSGITAEGNNTLNIQLGALSQQAPALTVVGALENAGNLVINMGDVSGLTGNNYHILHVLGNSEGWENADLQLTGGSADALTWVGNDLYYRYNADLLTSQHRTDKTITQGLYLYIDGYMMLTLNKALLFDGDASGIKNEGDYAVILDNDSVTFRGNSASSYWREVGGAIYNGEKATFTLSGNGDVTFSGNTTEVGEGGAIYNDGTFTLSDNGAVTFSGNTASGHYASGGAIFNGGTFTLRGNGDVTFSGNTTSGDGSFPGGAIYNEHGTFTLSDNGAVTFSGNTASDYSYGGAICNGGTFTLSGNHSVTFSGNTAFRGGAICNGEQATFTLSGNGDVTFSGNTVSASSSSAYNSSSACGGAICNGGIFTLSNNGDVIFEKNAEICNSNYRLRSIYSEKNYYGYMSELNLSASENHSILFRDSIYAEGIVNLNQDGTGDIILSGATTEADLREVKGGIDGTAEEILNSRTSEIATNAKLYGGRLIVEEGAILKGQGITITEGANAVIRLNNGEIDESGYEIAVSSGSGLEFEGVNTLTASAIRMEDGSTLSFVLGDSTEPLVNLNATLLTGNLSITLSGNTEGTHQLISLYDASQYDLSLWTEDNITLNGASFSDFSWNAGVLTYSRTATPVIDVENDTTLESGSAEADKLQSGGDVTINGNGHSLTVKNEVQLVQMALKNGTVKLEGENNNVVSVTLTEDGELVLAAGAGLKTGDIISMVASGKGELVISGDITLDEHGMKGKNGQKATVSNMSATTTGDAVFENVAFTDSLLDIGAGTTATFRNAVLGAGTRVTDAPATAKFENTLALLDSTNTEVVTESTTAEALQLYRSGDTTNAVTLDAGAALVDLTCTVFDTITLSGSDLYLDLTALAVTLGDADAFSLTFTNGTLAAIDTDSLSIYATLDGEHYLAGYTTQQGGMAEKVYFTTSASVPEPATATLSLLALAALAARRRRK